MEYYNGFNNNALGLGLCLMALNYANNTLYFSMNQNVSQSVNAWNQCQEQLLQTKIDNLKYQMLESQLNMQMQQAMIPTVTFPSAYTEQKKKVIRNIYDLDKIIFPYDPIRDWTEKKCKEIEEKYKWLDEVEFVPEQISDFVSKPNPASFVDAPKMKVKKGGGNLPNKKTNVVEIDGSFCEMMNYAVRYALGRRTYAVSNVARYVEDLIDVLDDQTIYVMIQDIKSQRDFGGLGMEMDKECWDRLQVKLQIELHNRQATGKHGWKD